MSRNEFPTSVRLKAFDRCGGRCEWPGCGIKVQPGRYAYDHIEMDVRGGANTLANCQVLCAEHHAEKTAGEATERAKELRRRAAHVGAKAPSRRPMPGSKASGWRIPFNGPPERRPKIGA